MRISVLIILILHSICCAWSQTDKQLDYDDIVNQLEKEIHKGKKRALRDLGSLLDKKEINQKIQTILTNATFFTPEEIDINKSSKLDFLGFYYDNEQNIHYSELLDVFYITPLEKRKIGFEMRSLSLEDKNDNSGLIRRYFLDLDELLNQKKYTEANKLMQKISLLKAINKERLLISLLKDERLTEFPPPLRNEFYENIIDQLSEYPEIEIVEIVLQLLEEGNLEATYATSFLVKITNCHTPFQSNPTSKIKYYQNLVDSLETLEEVRRFGYAQIFDFNISFFQFPVDYYGKILGLSATYPWIRQNALLDLKRSNHPRALYYIAADFYRSRNDTDENFNNLHLQLIKSRINVEIGVKDHKGKITFQPDKTDEIAMLNYLIYWASAYPDYEWDENRKLFTSKIESFAKTQNYERLFRRFNSKNDSIALLSFLQLTEGDPVEINTLAKKYRQLLRNHNNALPSMKYQYLEQTTQLTAFCRKNKVPYKPDLKLLSQFEWLSNARSEKERYLIENQLIETLTLDDITAFEYWACVHEKNSSFSLSTGRILDWFYSKNWKHIIKNSDNLRLYLKKSYLFGNIGVEGICNNYLNKFDLSNKNQLSKLRELGRVESDKDILNQILLLLEQKPQEAFTTYSFQDFIDDPLLFNQKDLKILPPPTMTDLEEIIEKIQTSKDFDEIKKLFAYLRLNADLNYVPALFKLIDDKRIIIERGELQISVADNIIPIVETIYAYDAPTEKQDHPFATDYWKSLWKEDSTNYQQWGIKFYQQQLDSLQTKNKISINDLNYFTESAFYSEKYKPIIFSALKKVRPIKNIRRLSVEPKLSVNDDLKYFEDFVFTYKVLDDIPKLFEIDNKNADKILSFLISKSSSFNYSEKGSFYNNLFRSSWINPLITSGNLTSAKADTIKNVLTNYLDESSFLSEFEEQTTILNIAKIENISKSLDIKLNMVFEMDVDRKSKAKIVDEIIATITYNEISEIVKYYDELTTLLGDGTCTFFHRDFGLPIFRIENEKQQKELLKKHKQLSEFEFYKYYLQNFGVDFVDNNGDLDFEKIYNILQFDIISPFASEVRSLRDEYIFGIIRLLEIKFETRLGFHEKLNNSQTFYSFSSAKRAEAWINYLQENDLITKSQHDIPASFNHARKEAKSISMNSTNRK